MLGLIVSIYEDLLRAFKDAEEYGCECIQIPASPWTIPNATEEEAAIKFRETWNGSRVKVIVAHVYSGINLASRNDELRQKYISVLTDEINRCDKFGISLVVLHPGHNPSRREGMNLLIEGLNQVLSSLHASKIQILLETMPGGKGVLGSRFEEMLYIFEKVHKTEYLGVCFDTCHVFAAGYDIRGYDGYEKVLNRFNALIGLDRLKVIHVNDSNGKWASRHEGHAFIGEGLLGLQVFHAIVKDKRFVNVPKISEMFFREKESLDLLRKLEERKDRLTEINQLSLDLGD